MPGAAGVSFGTTFAFAAATPPTAIPGIKTLEGGEDEVTQVQFGALDDSSRAFSYRNGRIKPGRYTATFEYRGGNYTLLKALLGHVLPLNFKIVYADGSNEAGTANLAKLGRLKAAEDDALEFTAEFQVNTSTFTEAT
jgi:hypothetical protein